MDIIDYRAKKKNKIRESTIENYYDLKVDKVDELVAALKEEPPADSNDLSMFISDCTGGDSPENYTRTGKKKQFDPYKIDFLGRIPAWIKAFFVKWWFAGAVCYFIMWGLQNYVSDPLDLIVLTGVILGLVVEILVNPLLRYMERGEKEYDNYHFEERIEEDDVFFPYTLMSGPATTRNAIALLKMLGYDEKIIADAEAMAKHFMTEGSWA